MSENTKKTDSQADPNGDRFVKMAQEDDAKRAAAPKIFNPAELMKRASTINEADHPILGKIRYGELTLDDSFLISKCKTDEDKSAMAAYLMLKKAYPEMPTYNPENISQWSKSMPLAEGAALLLFIRSTPAFLRTQSVRGLRQTATRKK
jgi:hypothetical protein